MPLFPAAPTDFFGARRHRASPVRRACARRVAARILLPAAIALLAPAAGADVFEQYGFGTRDRAMAGLGIATADDYTATYYNPAALARSPRTGMGLSFLNVSYAPDFSTSQPQKAAGAHRIPALAGVSLGFTTRLAFGGAGDIDPSEPFLCRNCRWRVSAGDDRCPNCFAPFRPLSESTRGEEPGRTDWQVGFGFGMFLPLGTLVGITAQKAAVPQWYNYEHTMEKIGILAGLAGGWRETVAFGIGVTVFSDADVTTIADVDIGGKAETVFAQDLKPDAAPNAGLLVRWRGLSVGAAYRGEISLKIETLATTNTTFFGVGRTALIMELEAVTLFSPTQYGVGAAYRLDSGLLFGADLTVYRWSAFPGTGSQVNPIPTSGISFTPVKPVDPKFKDITVPRLGVEAPVRDWLALRGGYYYRPTPTTDLKNVNNSLMDPAQHVFTFGLAWVSTGWPAYQVELFFQYHSFVAESVNKTSAPTSTDPAKDPAVPDLKFGGSARAVGLSFTVGF